ncbi:hypothetical protein SAMN04487994_102624 [Dolosicoccus paucivorans]|nr:hypothetical protein SAMN04487994_102624 [Dolosicoccus paucivorans]
MSLKTSDKPYAERIRISAADEFMRKLSEKPKIYNGINAKVLDKN